MNANALQIVTTFANQADAAAMANVLVQKHLAACVQVEGPITSCYRWQNKIEMATEWRCVIKTRASLYAQVEQTIRELHSYAQPEIIATEIVAGSQSYLEWLAAETSAEANSAR